MTQADHFCDLSSLGQQVAKIAKRINQDQIDILMDVKGYTLFSSPEILALRAAPIQINYLAFPATMGAKFIDFMIADKVSIPKSSQKNYSENILHLNNSYFVADSTMGNKIKAKNLEECGLPKGKIILASFNQPYKIDSEIFDVWMEILAEIENSILWLYAPKGLARINLEKYINQYYVKLKDKIFFADKLTRNEHLARIKNVDLVLDCKKCNGHTTTIDALSVGVPVVTILGNNIAQRGAASILHTYGLKELIAKNLDEYKNIILGYVSDRKILRELKKKSKDLRKNNSLFATKEYVSKLEKALIKTIKK